MKTAREHDRFIEDLGDDILRSVLDHTFILSFFGAHAKPNERICWFTKRTRAGETYQGRLRWFDKAVVRFVDGILNC